MAKTKYLILGAGPASAWAIRGIRKEDPEGAITLVGKEPYRTYNLPLLTKGYIQGRYSEDKLFMVKEDFYEKSGVEFLSGKKAAALDTYGKKVVLDDDTALQYEKLLICTGGTPVRFPFQGADLPNIYYLRTLDDARAVKAAAASAKKSVVIGGGFIGVELACALRELGLEVELLMLENTVWQFLLADEVSEHIMNILKENGITIHIEQIVSGFEEKAGLAASVSTLDDKTYGADIFCAGLGITLNTGFLEDSDVDYNRGVVVNEYLETSVPGIYAAGDVAEYHDLVFDTNHVTGHIESAQFQGQTAGRNMAGARVAYNRVTGYDTAVFGNMLMFIGAPHMGTEHIARAGAQGPAASFSLKYGRLVGVVLINPRGPDIKAARELIAVKDVDFKKLSDRLKDPGQDLSAILKDLGSVLEDIKG